ncbi:MAG: polyribonucleotide nucleotidyltransferase [Oligoflexales bacterium]
MTMIREVKVGDKNLRFEFGKYAKQANGSVMVSSGDTRVLVTVCAADEAPKGLDFFPLGVDYIEKFYAAGRIPGGFAKREAKPSDQATLNARVIDRPLRPSFPEGYRNETVITATVMSYEHGHHPAPLALTGASTALMISDIPFDGPVAGLRIGMNEEGEFTLDPAENCPTELDLTLACKKDAILMVEAGANILSEEKMLEAIKHGHDLMKPLFEMQEEVQKEFGKEKMTFHVEHVPAEILAKVRAAAQDPIKAAFQVRDKIQRGKVLKTAKNEVMATLSPVDEEKAFYSQAFADVKSDIMRTMILKDRIRIDERSLDQIRPIACETKILPRAHGSSLFTRGETQSLTSVTLGAADDQQRIETLWSSDYKDRFMLHYNFPAFSVGEARMQRTPGRREIGHGSLAKRALLPVMPTEKEFGYTVRLVSEILESNGSSSMATVCAGSMALLNAGVPLKSSVAGIAMGLIKEGDEYAILSDILGDEDHLGDMDFKVCGNADGISALQMDIKIDGLSMDVMREALEQAKAGRLHILGKMTSEIETPEKVSEHAPQIFKVKIKPDKIRDVIGPSGKMIKKITASTGARIDIEDNGIISIIAPDSVSAEAAKSMIRSATTDPELGAIYLGQVVRTMDFGAFIEIRPGTEGLCHISQLDNKRVEKVEDCVKAGDEVLVKVLEIDRQGRIKLSRKEAFGKKPTV